MASDGGMTSGSSGRRSSTGGNSPAFTSSASMGASLNLVGMGPSYLKDTLPFRPVLARAGSLMASTGAACGAAVGASLATGAAVGACSAGAAAFVSACGAGASSSSSAAQAMAATSARTAISDRISRMLLSLVDILQPPVFRLARGQRSCPSHCQPSPRWRIITE